MAFLFVVDIPCEKDDFLQLKLFGDHDTNNLFKDIVPEGGSTEKEKLSSEQPSTVGPSAIMDSSEEHVAIVNDAADTKKLPGDPESDALKELADILHDEETNAADEMTEIRKLSTCSTDNSHEKSTEWDFGEQDEKETQEGKSDNVDDPSANIRTAEPKVTENASENEVIEWDFGDEAENHKQMNAKETVDDSAINIAEYKDTENPSETVLTDWDFGKEVEKHKETETQLDVDDSETKVQTTDSESVERVKTQPADGSESQLEHSTGESADAIGSQEGELENTSVESPKKEFDVQKIDETSKRLKSESSSGLLTPLDTISSQEGELENASDESPKKEFDVQKIDETSERLKSESSSGLLTPFVKEEKLVTLLETVLKALDDVAVENVSSQPIGNGKLARISFVQEDSRRCEEILNKLKGVGVGGIVGTSLSVFPASVHESYVESEVASSCDETETSEEAVQKESEFKKSIKSRLVVAQVVASVRSNAQFTFDYLLLIVLASMIAALGLVENSSVVLVASMLISPLMGPILAGTFGQVIQMNELRNLGVKSELLGLLICLVVGFLCGLVSGGIGLGGTSVFSGDEWPTVEMKSRGQLRSLVVGVLIAVPSGAGVALSVLGGNAGSLVGVAISASLLPPAVNAGMLWAYALLAAISPPELVAAASTLLENITTTMSPTNVTLTTTLSPNTTTTTVPDTPPTYSVPGSCLPLVDNAYRPHYSCNLAHDAVLLAVVSLLLTLLNITCIFIMGIIVLKIKEVAPHTAASSSTIDDFWQKDVKVARSYYQTTTKTQNLGRRFLDEWKKLKQGQSTAEQTDDQLEEPVDTIDLVNYIKNVENSWLSRHLWSRLSPASPTQQVSSSLSTEYNRAALFLTEQISHNPAVYLNERRVATRNRKLENAYHTIHSVADSSDRPDIKTLRDRFRKTASMHIDSDTLTELNENVQSSPRKSRSAFGFQLNLSNNRLVKKRKSKTVQFDDSQAEEENLV